MIGQGGTLGLRHAFSSSVGCRRCEMGEATIHFVTYLIFDLYEKDDEKNFCMAHGPGHSRLAGNQLYCL